MKRLLAPIILVFITSCSALGIAPIEKPETVNQSFLLSYALIKMGYDFLDVAISDPMIGVRRGQAQDVKDSIDKVKLALDVQWTFFNENQPIDPRVFDNVRTVMGAARATILTFQREAIHGRNS